MCNAGAVAHSSCFPGPEPPHGSARFRHSMIVVCKKNVQLRRRAAPAGRRPIRSTSSGRHGAGAARSQPHQEERVPAARPPGAGRSGRTARASQPAAAHPLLQELASAPALPAPTYALAHPSPTRRSGTSSCTNSVRKKRNQMYLQCYFSHRTLLMAPVGLCSTAAASPVREAFPQRLAPACASCPASPYTQGPPLGVLALRVSHRGATPYTEASSGPPAPRGRRARGRGGAAAGNKYRSHGQ